MLKNVKEICSDRKKIFLIACTKSLVNHANYELENKDSRKILSHCRFKLFDCPKGKYENVAYSRGCLPTIIFV